MLTAGGAGEYKRAHSAVSVHLQVENTRRCCLAVSRGECDLAIVGGEIPCDLDHLLQVLVSIFPVMGLPQGMHAAAAASGMCLSTTAGGWAIVGVRDPLRPGPPAAGAAHGLMVSLAVVKSEESEVVGMVRGQVVPCSLAHARQRRLLQAGLADFETARSMCSSDGRMPAAVLQVPGG